MIKNSNDDDDDDDDVMENFLLKFFVQFKSISNVIKCWASEIHWKVFF